MKRQALLLPLILLGVLLVGCAMLPTENPLNDTEWLLVSYGPTSALTPALPDHQPGVSFIDGQIQGSTGCNSYSGSYVIRENTIAVGELAWTEMACMDAGVMAQESDFLMLLGEVDSFSIDGERLSLTGPPGALNFERRGGAAGQPLENRLWRLDGFSSTTGDAVMFEPVDERYLISAWFENGHISGSSGCNHYGASYEADPETSKLTIRGPLETTLAACLEEPGVSLEPRFVAALQAVESYQIQDDHLTLSHPDGELIFSIQPDLAADENAVYEALLRDWQGETGFYLLRENTRFGEPGISLDETLNKVLEQLSPAAENDPFALDPTTLDDFRARNQAPESLDGVLQVPFATTLLSDEELKTIFDKGETAGWQALRQQYPQAQGIYELSNIGFNQTGDQALVYLGLESEDFHGGWYSLLTRQKGAWTSVMGFLIWEQP